MGSVLLVQTARQLYSVAVCETSLYARWGRARLKHHQGRPALHCYDHTCEPSLPAQETRPRTRQGSAKLKR